MRFYFAVGHADYVLHGSAELIPFWIRSLRLGHFGTLIQCEVVWVLHGEWFSFQVSGLLSSSELLSESGPEGKESDNETPSTDHCHCDPDRRCRSDRRLALACWPRQFGRPAVPCFKSPQLKPLALAQSTSRMFHRLGYGRTPLSSDAPSTAYCTFVTYLRGMLNV